MFKNSDDQFKKDINKVIENYSFELSDNEIIGKLYMLISELLLKEQLEVKNKSLDDLKSKKIMMLYLKANFEQNRAKHIEARTKFIMHDKG